MKDVIFFLDGVAGVMVLLIGILFGAFLLTAFDTIFLYYIAWFFVWWAALYGVKKFLIFYKNIPKNGNREA